MVLSASVACHRWYRPAAQTAAQAVNCRRHERILGSLAAPPLDTRDHDVPLLGRQLAGRRVALMICGGIAAMKTPLLARALRKRGAEVTAFVSREALRYVTADALEWSTHRPVVERLSPAAEHLSDASPFDAYLLPQATYNTINKLACGIADGVLTSTLASALGRMTQGRAAVLVVPTMHARSVRVRVVPPRAGYGKHNIPDDEVLVAEVCRAVSRSPLRGRKILVTGGPTPVEIDAVRRLTNRFRGRLGIAVTEELFLRGAEPLLVHGDGAHPAPLHLPHQVVRTFDEYREAVHNSLADGDYLAGIFTAAVADYRPTEVLPGKTPSGGRLKIDMVPTQKVIEEVRQRCPSLHMVTFKYQEGVSHDELMAIGRQRLERYESPGCCAATPSPSESKANPRLPRP
nr:coenzyme A biosynthesis bifunctional protein CoaBC-like [Nerophis lumbriciformis]